MRGLSARYRHMLDDMINDSDFKSRCKFQCDEVYQYRNGYAIVKHHDKFGFMDESGNLICDIMYDEVRDFENLQMNAFCNNRVLAAVKFNGKWGFINEDGIPICKFKYDEVKDFIDDRATVKIGNKWGIIGYLGSQVCDVVYDCIKPIVFRKRYCLHMYFKIKRANKWGILDNFGEIMCDIKYDEITGEYESKDGSVVEAYRDGKIYVIDQNGKEYDKFIKEERKFIILPGNKTYTVCTPLNDKDMIQKIVISISRILGIAITLFAFFYFLTEIANYIVYWWVLTMFVGLTGILVSIEHRIKGIKIFFATVSMIIINFNVWLLIPVIIGQIVFELLYDKMMRSYLICVFKNRPKVKAVYKSGSEDPENKNVLPNDVLTKINDMIKFNEELGIVDNVWKDVRVFIENEPSSIGVINKLLDKNVTIILDVYHKISRDNYGCLKIDDKRLNHIRATLVRLNKTTLVDFNRQKDMFYMEIDSSIEIINKDLENRIM